MSSINSIGTCSRPSRFRFLPPPGPPPLVQPTLATPRLATISPAGGVSAGFSLPAGSCGLRRYGFPCAATIVVMGPGGQSVCTHPASRRCQEEPGCRVIGFSGRASVGYPRPPATTRRILLPQRFSVDCCPVHEQHAPVDHERRPCDKFCHPPPPRPAHGSSSPEHATPGVDAQPPPRRPARAPRTWCARRTLRTNNRLRMVAGRVRRAHHDFPPTW